MSLSRGCSLYKCAALCYTIHSIDMLYAEVSLMTNNPQKIVAKYGADILLSEGMCTEKHFIQHGSVSVYDHSLAVAVCAVQIALWYTHIFPWSHKLRLRSLVRGALLHDYFLYDWHTPDPAHRLHGFRHAGTALRNADRDFELNDTERDMIKKHMFPLNPAPPRFKETAVLCLADKYCALRETVLQRKKANK